MSTATLLYRYVEGVQTHSKPHYNQNPNILYSNFIINIFLRCKLPGSLRLKMSGYFGEWTCKKSSLYWKP